MNNKEKGYIVEDFITKYLENNDFYIINRNVCYWGGEIDIVAEKDNILHFVEVKCRKNIDMKDYDPISHKQIKTLLRSINRYLSFINISVDWQLDLFVVCMKGNRVVDINIFNDIIFNYGY